jgi:hypothetical protein
VVVGDWMLTIDEHVFEDTWRFHVQKNFNFILSLSLERERERELKYVQYYLFCHQL